MSGPSMSRPDRLLLVGGTGTEVGKTWVGCRLAETLRRAGHQVAARKVAQSFDPTDGTTDAAELAAATGELPEQVCPRHRWYEVAMAPFMAADVLDRPPITLADLVSEVTWAEGIDVGLIEPAGGIRSPMTHDGGDTVDLARAVQPDLIVLVADAGLGTLNAVRLCVDALAGFATVVFLNRYNGADDLHVRNRAWLEATLTHPLVTTVEELAARSM